MDCNRVGDGTGVDFIKVEAAFGWWMGTGCGYKMLEACGRGSVKVYTGRDELTFVNAGPLCPSPSFSALAPYNLNSSHTPSFARKDNKEEAAVRAEIMALAR